MKNTEWFGAVHGSMFLYSAGQPVDSSSSLTSGVATMVSGLCAATENFDYLIGALIINALYRYRTLKFKIFLEVFWVYLQ